MLTVEVPTFPTVIPAAWFAIIAASSKFAPEANANATVATEVSPAPTIS